MARLYHPELGEEYECPDDEGLLRVLAEAGWKPAPEPEQRPGYAPEPTKYEPVKPAPKTTKSTAKSTDK
jgi:hypothetical protein